MPFLPRCLQCLTLSPSSGPINFLVSDLSQGHPSALISTFSWFVCLLLASHPHVRPTHDHTLTLFQHHLQPLFASSVWHNYHSRSASTLCLFYSVTTEGNYHCIDWYHQSVSNLRRTFQASSLSFYSSLGQLLLFSVTVSIFTIFPNATIDLSSPHSWTFRAVSCFSIKKAEMSILTHISTSLQSFS